MLKQRRADRLGPKKRAWVTVVAAALVMSQLAPVGAAVAEEEDWLRELVLGLEVPGAATGSIQLPDALAELEDAQKALANAADALRAIEDNEHVRKLEGAATAGQRTAVAYLSASISRSEDLVGAADAVATQIDVVGDFATTAGESLNVARAAVLEARGATPDPAYQAALAAVDDAINRADQARIELRDASARAGLAVDDARAGAVHGLNDLGAARSTAAAKKTPDEPVIDVVHRSRAAVAEGVEARAAVAAAGRSVAGSVGEVTVPGEDLRELVLEAVERGYEARARATEAGGATDDLDGAMAELTDVDRGMSSHLDSLTAGRSAVSDATRATASAEEAASATKTLAESETIAASSLAAMDFVIPDPQTLLENAVADVNQVVDSLEALVLPTNTVQRLLEEAKAAAAQLINDPLPLPQVDLDHYVAAVRSAELLIYSTADSVTQMELLINDDVTPPSTEIRDQLVTVLNTAIGTSYAGLPENWKPTVDLMSDRLVDAQVLAYNAQLTVMDVGNDVDMAAEAADNQAAQEEQEAQQEAQESSGGTTPAADGAGCEVEYSDGVHIYWGNEKANECTGTAGVDIFHMRGASDKAWGQGASDQIHLAWGYDTAYGEDGADYIWGGTENDDILGQYGDDTLRDTQDTSLDGDDLWGGPGSDFCDILDGDIADSCFAGKGEDKEPKYDNQTWCKPSQGGGCVTGSDEIDMGN